LTAAVLVAAALQGENVVDLGLRYLARHQAADGSWGRRFSGCRCAAEPAPARVPADEPAIARLIGALDHEEPRLRDLAQKTLTAIGPAAVASLEDAAAAGNVEVRARCLATLEDIGSGNTAA